MKVTNVLGLPLKQSAQAKPAVAHFALPSSRQLQAQMARAQPLPEFTLPASKALRQWAVNADRPAAAAKLTKHKPGRVVQGGGATGSSWTAFLTSPDGKELNVDIVALSQLAAIALVRKAYPSHTLIACR